MPKSNTDRYLEMLARKRAPAVAEAERLVADDRYDEADRTVLAVDSSIYGNVELANLYRRYLEKLVAGGVTGQSRSRAEAIFGRAVQWADSSFPEPHTAEEAAQYDTGRAIKRSELVSILGYDPG
jgi:hypothetical protein